LTPLPAAPALCITPRNLGLCSDAAEFSRTWCGLFPHLESAMTIAQQIGAVAASAEARARCGEFYKFARLLTAARGDRQHALALAHATHAAPRVVSILNGKAAVTGGDLTGWAAVADYQNIATAFAESLRSISVFDALLAGGLVRAPLRSRGFSVTTGISGASVAERSIKPISSLVLASKLLEPRKASAIVVATKEVVQTDGAAQLFDAELRKG